MSIFTDHKNSGLTLKNVSNPNPSTYLTNSTPWLNEINSWTPSNIIHHISKIKDKTYHSIRYKKSI